MSLTVTARNMMFLWPCAWPYGCVHKTIELRVCRQAGGCLVRRPHSWVATLYNCMSLGAHVPAGLRFNCITTRL
jgi:hypothetical protein